MSADTRTAATTAAAQSLAAEVLRTGHLDGLPRGHFIDGAFFSPPGGTLLDSFDPGQGRVFARFAAGTADEVHQAVASARQALPAWRARRPVERAGLLKAVAARLQAQAGRLAVVEALDSGKRLAEALGDVASAIRAFDYYAGAADKLEGASIPLGPDYTAYTVHEPVGVVGQIVPWNFPLATACRGLAPALAAGCTVVLKPAEQTPFSALLLAELAAQAGLPPGVLNVVTGTGAAAGAALAAHPGIDHLTFTGSVPVGTQVMASAARHVTRVALELGGKSPHVLLADADLDRAIPDVLGAIFENAGQVCSAGARLIVEAPIRQAVLDRLLPAMAAMTLGHGLSSPDLGPVNSPAQLARIAAHVEGARARGLPVLAGGSPVRPESWPGGWFHAPTLIEARAPDDPIVQQEVFGPVLTLQPADDFEHALALANGTAYALVAGIHTRDLGRAHRFCRDVDAGQVYVNEYFAGGIETPFGGNRQSGFGRAKGMEGLLAYCQTKSVCIRHRHA